MSEYIFRWPANIPRLGFTSLLTWLDSEPERTIGTTVTVRRIGRGERPGDLRPVIIIELYGLAIALLRSEYVYFPDTRDGHYATTEWLAKIVRDSGIGGSLFRYPRRKRDGLGPLVPRGRAGILLIDGSRDRPLEGFAYRPNQRGEEPWCNHDGLDATPGRMCECGVRVPRHSDYRDRKAAELRDLVRARREAQGVLVTTVTLAEIAAEPGAPLSAKYWIEKHEREAAK
jgi:hypothetical protein